MIITTRGYVQSSCLFAEIILKARDKVIWVWEQNSRTEKLRLLEAVRSRSTEKRKERSHVYKHRPIPKCVTCVWKYKLKNWMTLVALGEGRGRRTMQAFGVRGGINHTCANMSHFFLHRSKQGIGIFSHLRCWWDRSRAEPEWWLKTHN